MRRLFEQPADAQVRATMDEHDEGAKVGLWVVLGIITLLLFGLIGGLVIRSKGGKPPPQPPVAAAAAAEAEALVEAPLSGALLVRVLFDVDKAELHADRRRRAGTGVRGARRRTRQAAGDRRFPRPQRRPGAQRRTGQAARHLRARRASSPTAPTPRACNCASPSRPRWAARPKRPAASRSTWSTDSRYSVRCRASGGLLAK